jgi:hypothetical protein
VVSSTDFQNPQKEESIRRMKLIAATCTHANCQYGGLELPIYINTPCPICNRTLSAYEWEDANPTQKMASNYQKLSNFGLNAS